MWTSGVLTSGLLANPRDTSLQSGRYCLTPAKRQILPSSNVRRPDLPAGPSIHAGIPFLEGSELEVHARPDHADVVALTTGVNTKTASRHRGTRVRHAHNLIAKEPVVAVPVPEREPQAFDLGGNGISEGILNTATEHHAKVIRTAPLEEEL